MSELMNIRCVASGMVMKWATSGVARGRMSEFATEHVEAPEAVLIRVLHELDHETT